MASHEYDNDGDSDVLLREDATGKWRMFLINNGIATVNQNPGLFKNLTWDYVTSGDYDGDGDADVLLRDPAGAWRMFVMENGASEQILSHSVFRTLILTVRSRHIAAYENYILMSSALVASASLHVLHRQLLG